MEEADYEVACTNFENLDRVDQRIIVMKKSGDNSRKQDQYLLQFNSMG